MLLLQYLQTKNGVKQTFNKQKKLRKITFSSSFASVNRDFTDLSERTDETEGLKEFPWQGLFTKMDNFTEVLLDEMKRISL